MKKKSSFDNGLRLRILTRHQAPALGAPLSILSTGKKTLIFPRVLHFLNG